MNYNKALETPKNGWKNAKPDNDLAVACQTAGQKHCINPKKIYEWAKKNNKTMFDVIDASINDKLLSKVL